MAWEGGSRRRAKARRSRRPRGPEAEAGARAGGRVFEGWVAPSVGEEVPARVHVELPRLLRVAHGFEEALHARLHGGRRHGGRRRLEGRGARDEQERHYHSVPPPARPRGRDDEYSDSATTSRCAKAGRNRPAASASFSLAASFKFDGECSRCALCCSCSSRRGLQRSRTRAFPDELWRRPRCFALRWCCPELLRHPTSKRPRLRLRRSSRPLRPREHRDCGTLSSSGAPSSSR